MSLLLTAINIVRSHGKLLFRPFIAWRIFSSGKLFPFSCSKVNGTMMLPARPFRRLDSYNRCCNGCPGIQCVRRPFGPRWTSPRHFTNPIHRLFMYLRRRCCSTRDVVRGKHREELGIRRHWSLCSFRYAPISPCKGERHPHYVYL